MFFVAVHMKITGELVNSPSTIPGMFLVLLFFGIPQHFLESIFLYGSCYLTINFIGNHLKRTWLILFIIISFAIYIYTVQAFFGGIIDNINDCSFFKSITKFNYFYLYLAVVYFTEISISFILKRYAKNID